MCCQIYLCIKISFLRCSNFNYQWCEVLSTAVICSWKSLRFRNQSHVRVFQGIDTITHTHEGKDRNKLKLIYNIYIFVSILTHPKAIPSGNHYAKTDHGLILGSDSRDSKPRSFCSLCFLHSRVFATLPLAGRCNPFPVADVNLHTF